MSDQGPLRFTLPPHGVLVAESIHDRGFVMDFEHHAFFEMYYVQKGKLRYFEPEFGPVVLEAGTVRAISAGVRHRVEDHTQATLMLFCIGAEFMNASGERRLLWDKIAAQCPLRPDSIACEQLEATLRRIMAEQASPRLGSRLMIEADASRLMICLGRHADRPSVGDARVRVRGVLELLERTYFEEWDLETAARRAHLSRRRFSTLFREEAGGSFVEKLQTLRVAHAARLLTEGRQTIGGAAFSSGFNDLSYFYQVFRREYGMTPGEWAEGRSVECGVRNAESKAKSRTQEYRPAEVTPGGGA
jgi:AraC-like DNA-binding protein/mannose-6-phosphate isomerase-like protein (cupin superfamily)